MILSTLRDCSATLMVNFGVVDGDETDTAGLEAGFAAPAEDEDEVFDDVDDDEDDADEDDNDDDDGKMARAPSVETAILKLANSAGSPIFEADGADVVEDEADEDTAAGAEVDVADFTTSDFFSRLSNRISNEIGPSDSIAAASC